MTVMLLITSFTGYSACSTLSSSNFTGTSSATSTQYNGCTGGSDAEYGDSGTIAKKVNSDPYLIWTSLGGVSILGYMYVAYTGQGKMADYFYSQIIDKNQGPPAENADVWAVEEEGAMAGDNPAPVVPPPPSPPSDNGDKPAPKPEPKQPEPEPPA